MRASLPPKVVEALSRVPEDPGCYRMRGARGEVLYVGKARSLRPRVRSYFQESAQHGPRIAALVAEVRDLEFIVTRSEVEALILENNLIKEHRPRYNVLLRDDKTFPYLKLSLKDEFPRVGLTRRPRADGSLYFGPFLPASHAWRTLKMIPKFFQVANCHLPFDGRQRPCLHYHLDQCLAPCAGKADRAEYAERVAEVRMMLEGRDAELRARVEERMSAAAQRLEFERAARYRDMLASLQYLSQRQGMQTAEPIDADFWAEHREGDEVAVELFGMRGGRVVGRRGFAIAPAPPPETLYDTVLPQFYANEEPPPEIVLPREPAEPRLIAEFLAERRGGRVQVRVPLQGERRRFLDLVAENAKLAFEARFRAAHVHGVEALEGLRDSLGLDEVPFRIEGFDISHTQGTETRASLVVFEGGQPKKADYRVFAIRTAEGGNDDYQSMREAVGRRYGRLQREGRRMPDLVLIDGGRKQLEAALDGLAAAGVEGLSVAAIAKRRELAAEGDEPASGGGRWAEDRIFVPGRAEPLDLDRHAPAFLLLQRVRDEAHRFANRHNRQARSRATFQSALTRIPGIGPTLAKRLLSQFGSLEGVRQASPAALAAAIGEARTRTLLAGLDALEAARKGADGKRAD